jgi:DNA-binding GntR family transcriptional regulator
VTWRIWKVTAMLEYDGPKYRAIMDSIKERILTGDLAPDEQLKPVRELALGWDISHATATKVMRELCREGYAYVRGNATYVRDRGQAEVTLRIPVTGRRRRNEMLPPSQPGSAVVLDAGIVVPPAYVSDVLGEGRGTPVLRRETVVHHHDGAGRVIRLAVHWHPASFAEAEPRLLLTDAAPGVGLVMVGGQVAEAALGRTPVCGLDSFHSRVTDEREARLMRIPIGSPVLARVTTWQDDQGVTEYLESVYPLGVVVSYEHRDPADVDDEA